MLMRKLNDYFTPSCRNPLPPLTHVSLRVNLHLADAHGEERWSQEKWPHVHHHTLTLPFIPKPQLTPFQSGSLRMERNGWGLWELAEG